MKRIRFQVTEEDIAEAIRRCGELVCSRTEDCPLAVALQRRFQTKDARVGVDVVHRVLATTPSGEWHLSDRAYDFMVSFDVGNKVRPAIFVAWQD